MTNFLRRAIACNGTNSACIDATNEVWVWGVAQSGLLGRKNENNQDFPKRLPLTTGDRLPEEKKLRDKFMRDGEPIAYEVHEIAMGQNHMLAVASDSNAKKDANMLEYAANIFRQLREHLISKGLTLFK